MWNGGVRVAVLDEQKRLLMVRQEHLERMVWTVPGGGVEPGETSKEAAAREVLEETGLEVEVGRLLWHVEQLVADGDQRFVNIFSAVIKGGTLAMGKDPELAPGEQVLREVRFMSREELNQAEGLYPEYLKDELWTVLAEPDPGHDPYRIRKKSK